ncbi:BCSC C-terminal domain-containing protein [bacterium]|nr:BCSC C-terminal domain-containing protein [bacterium]MBU1990968.1 BCSC C-terminal domain-containing protein [bacterium]
MITTHIRFIFLLLLINTLSLSKEVDVTFEVFNAKSNYMDIVQQKALRLKINGFNCYILKKNDMLSLRCNDSNTTEEMQDNIAKFKSKNISYVIINKDYKEAQEERKYKSLNEFYLGYAAFDREEYKKALEIFEYNYNIENNYEHAYAYALALMKNRHYEKALKVLNIYRKNKKANKLYKDIATTFMYKQLNKKNYTKAHEIVDNYLLKKHKLHTIINEKEISDLIEIKKYEEAIALANNYKLTNKIFDIDYLKALDLVQVKKYQEANVILSPYFYKEKKAMELLISNILSISSQYYEEKKYQEALDKLYGYLKYSTKVRELYNDILYNRALENGWKLVEESPKDALKFFKESCNIKNDYSCYSGMMYSYFNLKMYEQSLYLAEKLYEVEKTDELSVHAMRSAIKMQQLNTAKYWFDTTKNKKGLTNPYLLETFLTIDDYIKAKDYKEAANIVNYLISLYPQNVDVLKRQMQIFIFLKQYDDAHNVASEILLLDKESTEAKYTLSLYEFQHKDYKSCAQRLNDSNMTKEYQKELYYRCSAYVYAQENNINGAVSYIEKVQNNEIKSSFYLDIGNIYKNKGNAEAIRAYKEAKKYKSNDFNLELILLYTLKDFMKDDEVDSELEYAYTTYPLKTKELDAFKADYQKDRLHSYYKNNIYSRCYKYSNLIENELHDIDVYRMGGWCAYSLQKYDAAKEKFAKINLIFGENTEDIYGYALSCYQNNEHDRAIEALNRIRVIDNEKDAFLISSLYIDLHKQDDAKKILLKLPESKKRDSMLVSINKSFTKEAYENSASVGMFFQSQSGVNGKNRFDKYFVPVDYDYYNMKKDYHIYFDGDLLYLYNGYLSDNGGSYLDFGLNSTTQDDDLTSDIGFMPKLGIDYKNIKAQIGLTPVGAKITPEFTWLLAGFVSYDKLTFNLKFEQKEIDETMLSFVGEKAVKDSLEVNWGRVVKRGFEAGVSYDENVILSLNIGYYPQIFGLNTIDNSEFKSTVTAIYHPKVESISYVDIGALIAYDSYEKNTNLFTYGHGGYFSPQDFWLGSVFTQFGDIVNNDFYYQAKLSLGFEGFIVEDADKFPLSANDITLIGTQNGYSDGGITYKAAIQLGYNLNQNLDLISGFSMEKMNGYEVQQASFALVYRFEPKTYKTFNSFRLNHRVDQIIK